MIEDFTTYTEVDPNSKITVTSSKVSWDDLSRNESAYVYKTKGYSFFNKDFTHKFKIQFSDCSGYGIHTVHWAITDFVGDKKEWIDISASAVDLFCVYDYTWKLYLQIIEAGTPTDDDSWWAAEDLTDYYITITRDRDGGVNNAGRYTAYICTTGYYGEGGNLEDTLQIDATGPFIYDYHYVYACSTYNDGNPQSCDGFTEDLDLGLFNPAFAKVNNLIGGF